ncbi:MAG: DUF4956 domain-containing protein [Gammaproteobacteria bacterium]|nr:DUF4956 domain-containing protein [Gammaproteobacteria bacterium]
MNFVDYSTIVRDMLIDFVSLYFVAYVVLYRKFRNIEMFVSSALFNVYILVIVMGIVRTDFNIAIGFGLFALLSLIQLRSAQFSKAEMAYLFGAVALAVINGAGIGDLTFVLTCNVAIVLSTWFIGTWSLEHSANLIAVDDVRKMQITLDHIDETAIGNREVMRAELAERLGINVQSFEIERLDYVRDIVNVTVIYEIPEDEIPNFADKVLPALAHEQPLSAASEPARSGAS